jgi:hypothetical protein
LDFIKIAEKELENGDWELHLRVRVVRDKARIFSLKEMSEQSMDCFD